MSGPDYSKQESYAANIEAARANPASRKSSVQSFAERTGMSFEVLWHWFCTDDLAAVAFAKDPRRQNIYEKQAEEWIKKLPFVTGFKKLKNAGPTALYVNNGYVYSAEQLSNSDNPKSIDFTWSIQLPGTRLVTYYASHKYTHEDGGSQDNQLEDLKGFLREAAKLKFDKGRRFVALADGDYYQKVRSAQRTHMSELKGLTGASDFAHAMTCSELSAHLAGVVDVLLAEAGRNPTQEEETQLHKLRSGTL